MVRLKFKGLHGEPTYSAIPFEDEEAANKFVKRNKKLFKPYKISTVPVKKKTEREYKLNQQ